MFKFLFALVTLGAYRGPRTVSEAIRPLTEAQRNLGNVIQVRNKEAVKKKAGGLPL